MIKLIIERKIKVGRERDAWDLLHELRSRAMRQKGYISGETLKVYDDPLIWIVISTWLEAEDWRAWLNSSERKALEGREKEVIDAPIKATVLKFLKNRWVVKSNRNKKI